MAVDLDRWGFFRSNEFRWDYAPLPRANVDGKAGGFVGTNVLTVMKGTRHPELAWDWVTTMGGLKAQEARLRELNIPIIPSWKPLRAEYARLTPPDSIYVNIDIGEYGTQSIMSTAYVDMQTEILAGLTPVWNGQVAIRDAVAEVVRKVNELLRQAPQ
jgi:ABC-type glycerol-3-phosphate transport system substrate-binding protein